MDNNRPNRKRPTRLQWIAFQFLLQVCVLTVLAAWWVTHMAHTYGVNQYVVLP